jgi:polyferredoxin
MLTDEKIYNAALVRFRLGTVLIWLGVLTWLPFIVLRIAGEKPSLLWFLPFHLIGVIGGSRMRSAGRREMGVPLAKKSRLRALGHALILAGILVWVPYLYSKLVLQQDMEVMNYLPFHLAGILGGILVLALDYFVSRKNMAAEDLSK